VARLARLADPGVGKPTVRQDGTYLVTGGLGAIGLQVAEWLAGQGAGRLLLCGRRQPSAPAQARLEKLRAAGVSVTTSQTDVSSVEQLAQLAATIDEGMPPLRGVIHAAGVLDDGVLLTQTTEQFARVMTPKVAGAWNLHRLTEGLELDFFVCFSGGASVLGSPGQGNYAAANAFMDALAHYRHGRGRPALTINWGPWADSGMAAATEERGKREFARHGMALIKPQDGLRTCAELLMWNRPQVAVLPIDWRDFFAASTADRPPPLLQDLAVESGFSGAAKGVLLQALKDAPARERRFLLTTELQARLAEALGLDAPERIAPRQRLFEMGLDSLMAVGLTARLQSELDCSLGSTLLFDYPTLGALADHLADDVVDLDFGASSGAPAAALVEAPARAAPDLAELSDDEVAARLAAKLASIRKGNGGG